MACPNLANAHTQTSHLRPVGSSGPRINRRGIHLTQEQADLIWRGQNQIHEALVAFFQDIRHRSAQDVLRDLTHLNPNARIHYDVAKYLEHLDQFELNDRMSPTMIPLGLDIVQSGEDFFLLEINASTRLGGLGTLDRLAQIHNELNSASINISQETYELEFLSSVARELKKNGESLAKSTDGVHLFLKPAVSANTPNFKLEQMALVEKAFTDIGYIPIVFDPGPDKTSSIDHRIVSTDQELLYLNPETGDPLPVRSVFSYFHSGQFFQGYKPILRAHSNGQLALMPSPEASIVSSHFFFPLVPDLILHYLRAEPIFYFPKTRILVSNNRPDTDVVEEISQRPDLWVIKDAQSLGGKGVWLPGHWKPEDLQTLNRPTLAQKAISINQVEGQQYDLRSYSFSIGEKLLSGPYLWSRSAAPGEKLNLSGRPGGGKVNAVVIGEQNGCSPYFLSQ